jgi:IS1 family transposase
MIAWKQTSFGRMRGKRRTKYIYAYRRESGEIVAFVRGKRDIKTARKLRKRIKERGISYDRATGGNVFRQRLEKARIWQGRNIQWDRREQLPVTASDTEGISEDLLFFQETVQPLESF